jgi:hypothetical protein
MKRLNAIPKSLVSLIVASLATTAVAQKSGGTLRFPLRENPSSASLHEESSITAIQPFMAVFTIRTIGWKTSGWTDTPARAVFED